MFTLGSKPELKHQNWNNVKYILHLEKLLLCFQEDVLATDPLFVDYFNFYLSLPVRIFPM